MRLRVGFVVIAMVLSVFGARLVQLQGLDSESYAEMAAAEGSVQIVLPATRGDILDRNGEPLAESIDGLMLVADPQLTRDQAPELARFLADEMGLDYFDTLDRLRAPDSRFQYLARRVPAAQATAVVAKAEAEGFEGLGTERDPVREYPGHDVAANVVGFLGTPDPLEGVQPLAGLELTFNKRLAGKDGKATYQVGKGYRIPLADSTTVDPVEGRDLHTTLDMDLQWYTQRVLRQTVEDAGGDSGVAIVLDSRTGEILALADDPTYDASKPLDSPKEDLGSRALNDVYEPGSVEKVLTMSSLLDAGLVTPRQHILVPPELARQDRVIHDWFAHGDLKLTLAGVLAKSSNIGTVLAADKMSPRRLWRYLRGFGLGQRTNVGILGEAPGILTDGAAMTPQTKDRVAFGQSMSVNALQMAAAVNTIANGGEHVSPSLIEGSARTRGGQVVGTDHATVNRVVSAKAARQTARMMELVVDPDVGVAPAAAVPGYRVAGKTGTAQRVGEGCSCYDGTFTVSFAGFAPADDPRLTVYVVVQNPRNGGGGGSVAGPAFSKIMGYALRHFAVPPTGTKAPALPATWGQ
ncbi:peptidoglycan D,D-transpeptidase FtsI family protein [Nocardioides sp.]|uniref:peptidoglycan D,D-transpeptidase FtsI family protein n=1 Tax=Nocardioides sp. TaxID=35761 RepID=UPI00352861EA